jgi:DNA-binding CsgD family transcriptional regulator
MIPDAMLGLIYEGPMEDEPWLSFLTLFRTHLGAAATSLNGRLPQLNDRGFDVSVSQWDVSALRERYSEKYHSLNPFPYKTLSPGTAYRWSDFLSDRDFRKGRFYQEFCKPLGYEYALCLCLEAPLGGRAWLHAVRNKAAGNFSSRELAWCEALSPHFRRALRILYRLKQTEVDQFTFESAIHQLEIGTIVLDSEDLVLRSNRNADLIVEANECLSIRSGRLKLRPSALNATFQKAIESIKERNEAIPAPFSIERVGKAPLGLLLRKLPDATYAGTDQRPSLVLYLMDPSSQKLTSGPLLSSLFGLTKSEALLSALLVDGLTLADAAKAMHISEGSARIYSKRVFAKMGVSRQVELVRTILKSVASLARE